MFCKDFKSSYKRDPSV